MDKFFETLRKIVQLILTIISFGKVFSFLTIVFQLGLTFILTVCIYMIFALMDYQGGIEGIIGMTFIQPIFAAILSILTIIVCSILGLPIRMNKKIHHWWTSNFYISIGGAVCGLTMLFFSLTPMFTETIKVTDEGQHVLRVIPNSFLLPIGWFLTAFMTLHIFPPDIVKRKIENILTHFIGQTKKNGR